MEDVGLADVRKFGRLTDNRQHITDNSIRALPAAGLSAHTPTGLIHGPVSAAIPNAVSGV